MGNKRERKNFQGPGAPQVYLTNCTVIYYYYFYCSLEENKWEKRENLGGVHFYEILDRNKCIEYDVNLI